MMSNADTNLYISIIAETTYGAIELGAVFLNPSPEIEQDIYAYDVENLTNFKDIYDITNRNYTQIASESGILTIFFFDEFSAYQFLYRSKELHSMNCNTTENLKYAYPWNQSNKFSIAATSMGNCLLSIVPSASQDSSVIYGDNSYEYYIHILQIVSLKYEGPGKVDVVSGYNETYKLFDFSNKTYKLWDDTVVYGELISFIIPPDGNLYIEYENLNLIDKLIKVNHLSLHSLFQL